MFCVNCGKERIDDNAKFCDACGKDFPCSNTTMKTTNQQSSNEKEHLKEKPMTYLEFSKAKSKSWFKKVKGGTSKKSDEVMINIGLLAWNEKSSSLKPIRGKRLCLRTPSQAPYETLRSDAVKKMTNFYKDLIDESLHYHLAFENGEVAHYIPGTTEDFNLSKYKNKLGKDFKAITLYLLAENDLVIKDSLNDDTHGTENSFEGPCKKFRSDFDQELEDKVFAESLQALFDDEFPIHVPDQHDSPPRSEEISLMREILHAESENLPKSVEEILNCLSMNIKSEGHFFLNIRRNCDIQRVLNIWSRQKKQSPEQRLMVKFIGENGIDSGALSKEFFTDVIPKLGESMFPSGAPRESMSDVENGNFLYCGQIMAASLVQGGPPPSFLHKSVFNLLCDSFDIKNLKMEDFVPSDILMFEQIRNNPEENASFIIDNGYTGHISKENIDPILRTVMIGLISRRRTYLEEVAKGLQLYGLYPKIVQHKGLMEGLFIKASSQNQIVDSTYLISKLNPVYSPEGTNRKRLEEAFIDYLQDFINNLEDSNITAITEEAIANCDPPETLDDTIPYGKEIIDLSVAGLLGWLTGQKHCALFGEDLNITVVFNHDCNITYGPEHKVCYPIVSACSRQLTLPTQHCQSYLEFQQNFLLAFSKAQAFGRS